MRGVFYGSLALAVVNSGCSSSSTDDKRSTSDAGTDPDAPYVPGPVDPNGGRDDKPESCFASCQNTAVTCQRKPSPTVTEADLSLDMDGTGCSGTLGKDADAVALKIDCVKVQVCVGPSAGAPATTCVPGLFSPFAFSYAAAAGPTVCTRD